MRRRRAVRSIQGTKGDGARRRYLSSVLVVVVGAGVLALGAPDAVAADVVVAPVADSRVLQASPTVNTGTVSRLDVDNPGEQSYLRFNVTGVTGTVQSARLRLFVRNGSSNAPSIYPTDNTWTETGITWNNKPAATGAAIANVAAATAGTWSEYDLTGHITGNGTYNLVLLPDSTDGVQYDSREGTSPPQLVVTSGGPTNAPPVAGDDSATTPAGTPVTINVAANDTDPNGNLNPASATTTCTGCTTPTNGTLTNNANGTFTYTPTTGFTGTDSFTYQICDTLNACDTATVTINVTPVATNAPPVAGDDTATTPAGTPVTINVAANDTDPNGNLNPATATTTCTGCTTPTNGTLTNNANGTFTYTPTTGFTGTDSFTYQICDTLNACDTATVTINVTPVATNAPPVAGDDTATTPAGTPVTINVAANDTDPNGNLNPATATTTCTGCTTPTNGTLTNNANGTFTYTPTTGFTGTDSFTYQICDTDNACDTATVTINVNTVSAPQTLAAAADSRVLQASPTVNSGTVNRLDVDSPGEQSYLRFNVTGVTGTVQTATLRLFVRNTSANAPSLYFTDNTWTETGITWNNKPAATSAAIGNVAAATAGTWSEYDLTGDITGNGTYNFVLLPDSTDGVQYDSREGTSPPQLVLNGGGGGPTNAPPVAGDDSATTTAGTPVTINVAANDQDPNGNLNPASATTTCTGCANPGHGTLTNNANGTFTYTPTTGFTGADGFTYQICDTLNACDTATVTITVYAVGTGSEVFVGAGDIADCARTTDDATANLLDNIPGTVFTIGDNSYPATAAGFSNCYAPTWGRHKARTHPTAGDNDYDQANAAPYYSYFGAAAGDPHRAATTATTSVPGTSSTSTRTAPTIGGCRASSPQGQWLQADLAANPRACILAIHHEPLFSSKGGDSDMRDFWTPLYAAGADVVLSGHRHNYERFAPQTPAGVADPARGIRQFVVGTGGSSLSSASSTTAANSQVRNSSTHGVIKLTLHPTSYDWQFVPIAGQTFTDSGTHELRLAADPRPRTCRVHGRPCRGLSRVRGWPSTWTPRPTRWWRNWTWTGRPSWSPGRPADSARRPPGPSPRRVPRSSSAGGTTPRARPRSKRSAAPPCTSTSTSPTWPPCGPRPTSCSPASTGSTSSSTTPASWPARSAAPPTASRCSSARTTSATSSGPPASSPSSWRRSPPASST